jgi:hypothetical protein
MEQGKVLRRRGLLAGAAAVAAGVIAAKTADSVRAGNGDLITAGSDITGVTLETHLSGSTNQQQGLFHLSQSGQGVGLKVIADGNQGIYVWSGNNDGIFSQANVGGSNFAGLHGLGGGQSGNGVIGEANGSGGAYGVWGKTDSGRGVIGNASASGIGVQGTGTNGYGVFGVSTGSHGVVGKASNSTSAAVLGQSDNGVGVHGTTGTGLYGIVGESGSAAGSAGLLGVANGPNAVGFGTIAQGGATFAGYFNGTTVVNGTFAVTGGKSAAVKDASGDYRLMYSVEAPESWFEDFGTGTITAGKADITLDPQFAQFVRTDADYHVFITEHDQHNDLHVTNRTGTGFAVEADAASLKAKGKSAASVSGTFSWRVIGKRSDIKAERLAKFTMPPTLSAPPAMTPLAASELPKPMGPPQTPEPRPGPRTSAPATASSGTTSPAMSSTGGPQATAQPASRAVPSTGGSQATVQPVPPSRP